MQLKCCRAGARVESDTVSEPQAGDMSHLEQQKYGKNVYIYICMYKEEPVNETRTAEDMTPKLGVNGNCC